MASSPLLSQHYLCIQPPLQSPPKIHFSTSLNFYLPIPLLLIPKIILAIPTKTYFLYTRQFFTSLLLRTTSQQSTPKILSLPYPFSQFRLREGTRKLGSLMRTDTVLISIFFLKVCTVITGLTTTDPYHPGSENWCIAGSSL